MVVTEVVPEWVGVLIGLAISALAVGALFRSGFSGRDCFLAYSRLSGRGALALLPIVMLWPFVLATGVYIGFDVAGAVEGVFGSVAQELYFRAALLPALLAMMPPRRALILHTLAFGGWHGGALLAAPEALAGALAIIIVSLGAGYAWGWQTMRDRTVVWAMGHHSLLWIAGSFFDLSPPT
jgi:membrane protease YdiL (CAAX protease family)